MTPKEASPLGDKHFKGRSLRKIGSLQTNLGDKIIIPSGVGNSSKWKLQEALSMSQNSGWFRCPSLAIVWRRLKSMETL